MKKKLRFFYLVLLAMLLNTGSHAATFYKPYELGEIVAKAFKERDFAAMDSLATKLRTEKSRTPSGTWNLSVFYSNLDDAFLEGRKENTEAQWDEIESSLNRWVASSPHSAFAPILLATAQISHAWALRGGGYADTVTAKGWEGLAKNMAAAHATLQANKKISSVDPQWYVSMLTVALAQSWKLEDYMALYEEAVSREPLYYATYFAVVERLRPAWGGDMTLIRKFATDAVRRTAATDGQGMYARIYWVAEYKVGGKVLFAETHRKVVWDEMKAGFEDLLKKYPVEWNRNAYAKFACQSGDPDTFISQVRQLKGEPMKGAWPGNYFQRCKDFARQARPNNPL